MNASDNPALKAPGPPAGRFSRLGIRPEIPENRHFAAQPALRSSKNQTYGADIRLTPHI
jgi:hypothetical protein